MGVDPALADDDMPTRSVLEIVEEVADVPTAGVEWQALWTSAMSAMVKGSQSGGGGKPSQAARLGGTRLAPKPVDELLASPALAPLRDVLRTLVVDRGLFS